MRTAQQSMIFFHTRAVTHRPNTRLQAIALAVTEGPVREEQLLHDMCLLGAVTVEITQILTRAGNNNYTLLTQVYLNPSKIEPGLVMW